MGQGLPGRKLTSPGVLLILAVTAACCIFLLDVFYLQSRADEQKWSSIRTRSARIEEAGRHALVREEQNLRRITTMWANSPSALGFVNAPLETDAIDRLMERSAEALHVSCVLVCSPDGGILRAWDVSDHGHVRVLTDGRARDVLDELDANLAKIAELPAAGFLTRGQQLLQVAAAEIREVSGDHRRGFLLAIRPVSDSLLDALTPAVGGDITIIRSRTLPAESRSQQGATHGFWQPDEDSLAVAWAIEGLRGKHLGYLQARVPVADITRQAKESRRMVLIVLSRSTGLALLVIVGTHMLITGPVIRLLKRLQKLEVGEGEVGDLVRDMHGEPLMLARRLEEAFDKLAYMSKTDQLTGLANRRHFEEVLHAFYYQARRYNRSLSLIIMDIDFFKAVNDTVGHQAGDELLKITAREIENVCRKADLPARLGGDEFAVLLPETTSESAAAVADRIRQAVAERPMEVGGVEINATVSIGLADLNAGEMDCPEGLMSLADRALYAAKELGRNQTVQAHKLTGLDVRSPGEGEDASLLQKKLAGLDQQFKHLFINAVEEVANILGDRDPNMLYHARNVQHYATLIAREMELPSRVLQRVQVASVLHDIGMLSLPDDVLLHQGQLDVQRLETMRQHPLMSVRIMERMEFLEQEIPAVRYHHERWDGKGYPEGVAGAKIPLSARIIAVADAFDSITSDRVYRGARDRRDAIEEIKAAAGSQFDPVVVNALVAIEARMGEEMMARWDGATKTGKQRQSEQHSVDSRV